MTEEPLPERVPVTLNPDGVAAPIHRSVRIAAEALAVCLPASEAYDFGQAFEIGPVMHRMRFEPVADTDSRRTELSAWIIGQAVGEIARGVRSALEEAYLFAVIATRLPARLEELGPMVEGARREANDWGNPQLLARLGALLTGPLTFEAELTSLQRLRNCLEHRAGYVGDRDAGRGGQMTLTLPRLAIMHRVNGEAQEVQPGVPLAEGENELWAQRVNLELTFRLGERVTLSVERLGEMLAACHFLAADLLARLPMPAELDPTGE
jgi:hypothetical protein